MAPNPIAENVLGIMGKSFLLSFPVTSNESSIYRHNLLEWSNYTSNLEKLPREKYSWSFSLDDVCILPFLFRILRTKNFYRLIWGFSSALLGVYAVLQRLNIPLQLQPQLFGFLAFLSWGQVCLLPFSWLSVPIPFNIHSVCTMILVARTRSVFQSSWQLEQWFSLVQWKSCSFSSLGQLTNVESLLLLNYLVFSLS